MATEHPRTKKSYIIHASMRKSLWDEVQKVMFKNEGESEFVQEAVYRLYLHRQGLPQVPKSEFPDWATRRRMGRPTNAEMNEDTDG